MRAKIILKSRYGYEGGGGAKSPGQTHGPGRTQTDKRKDGQTDMPEWVQTPQVNAKCDVVMKLSVFGTRTDTHTHKAKPIHPRYAGCNKLISTVDSVHEGCPLERAVLKAHWLFSPTHSRDKLLEQCQYNWCRGTEGALAGMPLHCACSPVRQLDHWTHSADSSAPTPSQCCLCPS